MCFSACTEHRSSGKKIAITTWQIFPFNPNPPLVSRSQGGGESVKIFERNLMMKHVVNEPRTGEICCETRELHEKILFTSTQQLLIEIEHKMNSSYA